MNKYGWIYWTFILGFVSGILITAVKYELSSTQSPQPQSQCKPTPGQCAFDGYGVYCLLPRTEPSKPLRNGEPK